MINDFCMRDNLLDVSCIGIDGHDMVEKLLDHHMQDRVDIMRENMMEPLRYGLRDGHAMA